MQVKHVATAGNNAASQAVTIGWPPVATIVKGGIGDVYIRGAGMGTGLAKPLSGSTQPLLTIIDSLDASGFTLGSSQNASGTTYRSWSFRAGGADCAVVAEAGQGAAAHDIALAFDADAYICWTDQGYIPFWSTRDMPAGTGISFTGTLVTNVASFGAGATTKLVAGSNLNGNPAAGNVYFLALKDTAGVFKTFSYTGNNQGADKTVTGLTETFTAALVGRYDNVGYDCVIAHPDTAGTSYRLAAGNAAITDGIKSFGAGSMVVGVNSRVNGGTGDTFYGFGWVEAADITAPTIGNIVADPDETTAEISATTDEAATVRLRIHTAPALGGSQVYDNTTASGVSHSWNPTGLSASTPYYMTFVAVDPATNSSGNVDGGIFTTDAADVTAPVATLAGISVRRTQATIAVTTNEAATVRFRVNTAAGLGGTNVFDNTDASQTAHSWVVTPLSPGTTYYYHALPTDPSANVGTALTGSFITQAANTLIGFDVDHLETEVTFNSIGVKVPVISGTVPVDSNKAFTGVNTMRFKKVSEPNSNWAAGVGGWRAALEPWFADLTMYQIAGTAYDVGSEWNGSVLLCDAGTAYDVEVTIGDGQGHTTVMAGQATTRAENIATRAALLAAATRFLDPVDGLDGNTGTSAGAAWKTLAKAFASAPAGAIVSCKPGDYFAADIDRTAAQGGIVLVAEYPAATFTQAGARVAPTDWATANPSNRSRIWYGGAKPLLSGPTASGAPYEAPWTAVVYTTRHFADDFANFSTAGTFSRTVYRWTGTGISAASFIRASFAATLGGAATTIPRWNADGTEMLTASQWSEKLLTTVDLVAANQTGLFVDGADLYIRLPNGVDPNTVWVEISQNYLLVIHADDCRFSGFEFRTPTFALTPYYPSKRLIVDQCLFINAKECINGQGIEGPPPSYIGSLFARDLVVQHCIATDNGNWTTNHTTAPAVPWNVVKRYLYKGHYASGTVTSATSTTLTDSTKAWTVNEWAGHTVYIASGQGAGDNQKRTVVSNTATTLTVSTSWASAVQPDATSGYTIAKPFGNRLLDNLENNFNGGDGGVINSVFRYNSVSGYFNGLAGGYNAGYDHTANSNNDFDHNYVTQGADDGLEPDSQDTNCRFWENLVTHFGTFMSLGPSNMGPLFIFKNRGWQIGSHGVTLSGNAGDPQGLGTTFFKYSATSIPPSRCYIIANTFWTDRAPSGTPEQNSGTVAGAAKFAGGGGLVGDGPPNERFYLRNNIIRVTNYAWSINPPAGTRPMDENYNFFATSDAARALQYLTKYTSAGVTGPTSIAQYRSDLLAKNPVGSAVNTNKLAGVDYSFLRTDVVDANLTNAAGGDLTPKVGGLFIDAGAVIPNILDRPGVDYFLVPDLGAVQTGLTGAPAPSVAGVAPASGTTAGGLAVTVSGSGFVAGATLTFGGTAATGVTVVNSTTITCTTPAHAAGAVSVVVTNPDAQTGTLASAYTYVVPAPPAPTVTGVSPASGSAAGGTALTLTGTGFVATPSVTVGGVAATSVVRVSATTVTCVAPAHAAGAVAIVLTNPDGLTGTLASGYTYTAIPVPPVGAFTVQAITYRIAIPTAVAATGRIQYGIGAAFDLAGDEESGPATTHIADVTLVPGSIYRARFDGVDAVGATVQSVVYIINTVAANGRAKQRGGLLRR